MSFNHQNTQDTDLDICKDDFASTMMVDLYYATVASAGGNGYTEYVLSACESHDMAILDIYVKEEDCREVKSGKKVPYQAINQCMDIIKRRKLETWENLEFRNHIDGGKIVCKFWNGKKHIRVSSENMPDDGLEAFEELRNTIEKYMVAEE